MREFLTKINELKESHVTSVMNIFENNHTSFEHEMNEYNLKNEKELFDLTKEQLILIILNHQLIMDSTDEEIQNLLQRINP